MRVPVRKVYTSKVFEGTDPEKSEAEVYSMKMDEFDRNRNMAIFDIRKVRPETLYPTCQEIYSDFQILHETFVACLRVFEMPGWHDSVVVAGGAPLALLEAHLMTCREGDLRVEGGKIVLRNTSTLEIDQADAGLLMLWTWKKFLQVMGSLE